MFTDASIIAKAVGLTVGFYVGIYVGLAVGLAVRINTSLTCTPFATTKVIHRDKSEEIIVRVDLICDISTNTEKKLILSISNLNG